MKHLALVFVALLTLGGSTYAAEDNTTLRRGNIYDGSKYIFVEDGIEFSIFPDGEFDFYIPQYVDGVSLNVSAGPVGISFNTGFDYDPYVQYDEFGAVIQIENTPLFYDYYGRLTQAGNVNINYRNNRIARVGGLRVFYNNAGLFSHYSGFINVYNTGYVFQPYHNFFYRPIFNRCLVFTTPYRQFYNPIRYNYAFHRNNYFRGYNNGYANARRDFRRPNRGRVAHNNGRRGNVDRNNSRFNRAKVSNRYENLRTRNGNSRGIAQSSNIRDRSKTNLRGRNSDPVISQRGIAQSNTNDRKTRSIRRSSSTQQSTERGIARNTNRGNNARGIASSNNDRKNAVRSKRSQKASSRATTSRPSTSRSAVSNRSSKNVKRSSQRLAQSRKATTQRATPSRSTQRVSKKSSSPRRATAQRSARTNSASRSTTSRRSNARTARRQ